MRRVETIGRPAGLGAQLRVPERSSQSRTCRAAADSTRLALMLSASMMSQLTNSIEQRGCQSKKDAIVRAIQIAALAFAKAKKDSQ